MRARRSRSGSSREVNVTQCQYRRRRRRRTGDGSRFHSGCESSARIDPAPRVAWRPPRGRDGELTRTGAFRMSMARWWSAGASIGSRTSPHPPTSCRQHCNTSGLGVVAVKARCRSLRVVLRHRLRHAEPAFAGTGNLLTTSRHSVAMSGVDRYWFQLDIRVASKNSAKWPRRARNSGFVSFAQSAACVE